MQQVGQEPAGTERVIRVGDLQVGVIDDGGDGVPLVLVHGGESDRTQFTRLRAYLGPGIRAISYDQRDSGITVNPPEPYTMETLADDLVGLLDALGLQRANLLGTSFGGALVQHTAIRYPDRVDSIILVCSTPSWALCPDRIDGLLQLPHEDRQKALQDLFVTPEGQARLGGHAGRVLTYRDPEKTERRHAAIRGHEVRDRLADIKAPTLIVHGTEDPIAPYSGAVYMQEHIPNARLRPIAGGRHAIALEFAEELAGHVREFLGVPTA
jgi:Predicted hydrolases or acyltransferases (alpha/beta hydrolase superfamily)